MKKYDMLIDSKKDNKCDGERARRYLNNLPALTTSK